mmetsp:Transcript_55337/g.159090  ORF Transcript_55337/g.159090 Transcript_55337/m.159090 type:complete len:336 (-) Transcript_55337:31-1038(-)
MPSLSDRRCTLHTRSRRTSLRPALCSVAISTLCAVVWSRVGGGLSVSFAGAARHASRRPVAGGFATASSSGGALEGIEVDTIIFDIDDTLYPASCGFSNHRMSDVTKRFMVERLGFQSEAEAMALWSEYIQRYHSSLKGFKVATEEGRLPIPFRQEELGTYWADNCDFGKYIKKDTELVDMMRSLQQEAKMKLVAFTNAPRAYAIRSLEYLGIREYFADDHVFAVEDVLPACKPERAAFEQVMRAVGAVPERTVMFEDSMKNIRACRELGIHTVLIHEDKGDATGEAKLLGDAALPNDPSVDATLARAADSRTALPGLWRGRFAVGKRALETSKL